MATYVPNATQTTEPVESQTVESAALEFRTLKTSINGRVAALQTEVDTEETTRAVADAALTAADVALSLRTTALEQLAFNCGIPGTVVVTKFVATASQIVFPLSVTPLTIATVDVYINGIYQNHDSFSLAANVVTLNEPVIEGAEVEIQASVALQLGVSDANLVWYLPAGVMAVATTAQAKLHESVSVKDFGAVGDGVTDDSIAVNAGLLHVQTNGGTLLLPAGTFRVKNLRLDNGVLPWAMRGAGKVITTLEHTDGDGTLLNDSGSVVGYDLSGFTINCKFSTYAHASARNGLAILHSSNINIDDVHVTDFKLSAMLIYDDNNSGGTYGNVHLTDCSCDGLGVASNGFLFSNMDNCTYLRCEAVGVVYSANGPGIGVQFKNRCRYGSMTDIYASGCTAGIGFSGDTLGAIPGPAYNTATNIRIVNPNPTVGVGMYLTNAAEENTITNLYIDMNGITGGGDAISCQEGAFGNSVTNTIIKNLGAAKRAVRCTALTHDNYFHIAQLDNINTTGQVFRCENTATFNHLKLSRMMNPRVRSGEIYSMALLVTAADCNSWEYDSYPMVEARTIAAGIVATTNTLTTIVNLDTEAAAATDDLDTIANTFTREGQVLTLRSSNDSRDIVVKTGVGNIALTGAVDFTLTTRRSYITLIWNSTNSKWNELARVTNP